MSGKANERHGPIRIGLLGAARITPRAVIDPAAGHHAAKVRAVAARDPERATAFAERHGIPVVYDGYEALVTSDDIDLVYNALPVNHHAKWSIAALNAGKHVLCEKPLAMNHAEASAMVAAAERNGRRLVEAFHYRYHPLYLEFLEWLRAGRIGTPQSLTAVFNAPIRDEPTEIRRRIDTGGGAMMDLGCYALRWAQDVAGVPVASVESRAMLTDAGVDESMEATLTFDDGLVADISTSMHADNAFEARLDVEGSAGRIRFDNPLAPQNGSRLELIAPGGNETATVDTRPTFAWQLDAVVEAIRTGGALPTEGEAILQQQALIDDVYAAAGLAHLRQIGPA